MQSVSMTTKFVSSILVHNYRETYIM